MTRAGRTHKLNRWEWPVQDIYRRTLRIALDDLSRISAFPARNPCQFGLHVASAGPFGFEFREGRACLPVCAAPADSLIRHSERLGRIASVSWSSFFRHSDRGSSFKLSELQTPDASRSYWVTGIPAWSAA